LKAPKGRLVGRLDGARTSCGPYPEAGAATAKVAEAVPAAAMAALLLLASRHGSRVGSKACTSTSNGPTSNALPGPRLLACFASSRANETFLNSLKGHTRAAQESSNTVKTTARGMTASLRFIINLSLRRCIGEHYALARRHKLPVRPRLALLRTLFAVHHGVGGGDRPNATVADDAAIVSAIAANVAAAN
jgi:hypothetical protein